jgi:hypothetical protein
MKFLIILTLFNIRVKAVRFIRMRKQIHDYNTAINGSVMQ